MQKSIFFNIDELARDAIVASGLKKALKPHDIHLEYGNRFRSRVLPDLCPFDGVIFPSVDLVQSIFKDPDKLTVPSLILPTEGVGGFVSNSDLFSWQLIGAAYEGLNKNKRNIDKRWAKNVTSYCLWGEQQYKNVAEHAPLLIDKCEIVGHPRHDQSFFNPPKKLYVENEKIKIAIITRFDPMNTFNNTGMIEQIYKQRQSRNFYAYSEHDDHLDVENLYFTAIFDVRILLDIIDQLDSNKYEVIIRVHPRENRLQWETVIKKFNLPAVLADWTQPFSHFAKEVDYILAPPSTTFYDCLASGTTSISIDRLQKNRSNHTFKFSDDNGIINNFVHRPETMNELLDLIKEKPKQAKPMPQGLKDILAEETDYPNCDNSIHRLAEVCKRIVSTSEKTNNTWFKMKKYQYFSKKIEKIHTPVKEQSSKYALTPERIRWIDDLTY